MPGIAGMIGVPPDGANASRLESMVKCMLHESFYTSGSYVNARLGVWLGWCNHPGSFSDCLPVWNETRDILLIFSGEDFAEPKEVDALRARGHQLDSENASYLVHGYEEEGLGFLQRLNGWFSGVLVDLRQNKVLLFGDRYGLNRIYYHEPSQGLYFSSEAKSILKVVPRCRAIDERSLAEGVSCGCVLQNRTLFAGISLLPGASIWTFSPGQLPQKGVYFHKETWEKQELLGELDYYKRLKQIFTRILPRYLRNGNKMGMSLTGGLDGRMIMAWARCAPEALPCYTFGGSYRDCSDVRIARAVAKVCGQPHHVIPVDGPFLAQFHGFAERAVYISDGAMDVTGAVELYVNHVAREVAPIRMTGNYGSEILRGNVAFKPSRLDGNIYTPDFVDLGQKATATYAQEAQGHPVSFIAFKQVPWHHRSRLSVEQSQLTLRAPYLDNELVALMYQAPPELVRNNEPSLRLIAEGNQALSRIPTDRGLLYHPLPVATWAQRSYQEFTIKAEYAYDYGMPQWLARIDHVFAPFHLEKLFLGRHKFYHFRVWYRDNLAAYLKEVLLDSRTLGRPYVQGRCFEELVNRHVDGRANFTSEIHQLLTLELIHRQLIESN